MSVRSLFAIGLILAGALATAVAPAPGRAQSSGAYIALGDSVAAGIGSSLPRTRSYPALLHGWMERQADAPVLFVNLAEPGETVRSFIDEGQLDRLREEVQRARDGGVPLLAITITLGGNDILNLQNVPESDREQSLEQFRTEFPDALARVREVIGPDVPLVVTTYYDPSDGDAAVPNTASWWIAEFNEVITEAASTHGALLADVAAAFEGRGAGLTRYPVDVHPTNEGHLTIARSVWEELAIDDEPPQVAVLSPPEATRRTPTIRFQASDDVALRSLSLEISDGEVSEPVPIGDDEFVALADLRDVEGDSFDIVITAVDEAGNVTEEPATLEVTE